MAPAHESGRADPVEGPGGSRPSGGSGPPGDASTGPDRPGPPTQLDERPLDQPHPDRLPPDRPGAAAILLAHREALDAGRSGYLDPATGLFVLTASYLAARGVCCETGCRHCPYLV
jgi:hypothetical protein